MMIPCVYVFEKLICWVLWLKSLVFFIILLRNIFQEIGEYMPRKVRIAPSIQAYGEGVLLRQMRSDCGMSLTEMAKKTSYDKGFLSNIETGKEKASKGVIDGYEKQLCLAPGELQDRIDALRSNSPEKMIELLSNNWQL